MTNFLNYPQELGVIQLDLPNELYQFGSATPSANTRISKVVLAMYLSGVYAPTADAKILLYRASDSQLMAETRPVPLNSIGNGFLGRVRFDFDQRIFLTSGETYNFSIQMQGYTPAVNPSQDAIFCAIIKNSPTTITYTGVNTLVESSAAFEIFEEV